MVVHGPTLNNLGAAYWKLATGDREENLRAAIEAYEAALTVLTGRSCGSFISQIQLWAPVKGGSL